MFAILRLTKETRRRLDALSEATHRPRSFHLREAIERGLPQVEWEYDIAQRATDGRSGAVAAARFADVVGELGLDD